MCIRRYKQEYNDIERISTVYDWLHCVRILLDNQCSQCYKNVSILLTCHLTNCQKRIVEFSVFTTILRTKKIRLDMIPDLKHTLHKM